MKSGVTINAEIIMLLAAVGIANLEVFQAAKLQIFSTGNEIIDYNEPELPLGKIYNSTAPYLLARAKEIGVEATYGGVVADDAALFEKLIAQIPSGNIIITTGAVSMGKWDFIPQSLSKLGAKIHFHKVNIRPGKPIIFATLPNGNLFFGLPGNPISSAIGFKFFVEPALRAIGGKSQTVTIKAKLENSFTNSWAILPESASQFSAGEEIEIVPFGAEFGF
ncbi:MAG: molybdenum cofactor synthesis domain protein [Hyphomonadaceae bacterium]|nr:MAG: molybdenum cofactor synthesis domain protein [Hyphomonadaceae bacterium]